jgi:diguanylate cyclase (GGDEF)-like protein
LTTLLSEQKLLASFGVFKPFTKIFMDAYLLVTPQGRILSFNSLFSLLVETSARQIKNQNIFELIDLKEEDKSSFHKLLVTKKPLRLDDLTIEIKKDAEVKHVTISSYPLFFEESKEHVGSCLLLRDVSAETHLLHKYSFQSKETQTDPLTGLFTRRVLSIKIRENLLKLQNEEKAFGCILLDLDHFKQINDTYGHHAGDAVLKETAKLLYKISRKEDVIARYGGEEIIILMSPSDAKSLKFVCEKIRQTIEAHVYTYEGDKIKMTVSIGAYLCEDPTDEEEKIIRKADGCLYSSKKAGRNCTHISTSQSQGSMKKKAS